MVPVPGSARQFGPSPVAVTALSFGGAPIAGLFESVGDRAASDAIAAAWDAGIRAFDTAPLYGCGLGERRLGAALRNRPRAEVTVSTKVGRLLEPAPAGRHNVEPWAEPTGVVPRFDFSADGVKRSLAASLERLAVDRIDIVHVHDPEDHLDVALRDAFPVLLRWRDEGVIGAVSAGMNYVDPLIRIVREVDVDGLLVAGCWNLLDRSAEALLDLCGELGKGVLVAGVFGSGMLANPAGGTWRYQSPAPEVAKAAAGMAAQCAAFGVGLRSAAIQFPWRHAAVSAVLVGMRSPEEVRAAEMAFSEQVPIELWEVLGVPR